MSAIPGLNPSPVRAEPIAPEAAPHPPKRSHWFRLLLLLALVGGGAWAGYQYFNKPRAAAQAAQAAIRTVRVTSGPIQRVLRLSGSTTAKNFASIAAPRLRAAEGGRGLILIYLAKSGSIVKKGDVVAQIDTQSLKDQLSDIEDQVLSADSDIKKRKADIALNGENLQQTLRAAKAGLDKNKLDAAATEIRTAIDAEELRLSVEEAQATYNEQLKDLDFKKASDTADLRSLEIGRQITVGKRDRFKSDIEKFTIAASMSGLAVMTSLLRGAEMAQVQQGDQVAPGQLFMKIVDVSGIQVQASASQVESEEMRLGESARIAFDAFPDLTLNARVSNIGAIATPGSTQNYFLRNVPVYLTILDRDSRVIPDLTTSSDVVVSQTANALLVPRSALESRDGKWFVRVRNGPQFELRQVKLGMSDNVRVAILEGVREGEEVALDQPPTGPLMASN
jgi:HlyD family secretion protein